MNSIEGRIPPQDLTAEGAVLSGCLVGDGAVFDALADILRPEHFYSESHRRIFEAITELRSVGKPSDIITVGTFLKDRERIQQVGGMAYLTELLDVAPAISPERIAVYASTVREKWRVRQVLIVCQRAEAVAYTDYGDAQDFLDGLERDIHEIARSGERTTQEHLRPVLRRMYTELAEAAKRGDAITGISVGFQGIDKKTAGLHDGDLTIIAARPGMGKTSYMLDVASNVARDPANVVQVFSLEMPREQLAARMTCSAASVDVTVVRAPRSLRENDWGRLVIAVKNVGQKEIYVDDKSGITLLEMRSKARRLASEVARQKTADGRPRRLVLIAVDYLQLMHGARRSFSREQEIAEISGGLKELAKELKVAVVALSQLNRSTETRSEKNKRPQLSDLRESGAIEQDADVVQFLYRPAYYAKQRGEIPERGTEQLAEVIIAKQRNGPTGIERIKFEEQFTRFSDFAPGEDQGAHDEE